MKLEGAYGQNSSGATNATILSGDDFSSQSGLQNESISYFDGSSGYLVYPNAADNNTTANTGQQKLPAVVMIHEWWGVNDEIKDMANELASEDYVVLAADLYHGEVATEFSHALIHSTLKSKWFLEVKVKWSK